MKAISYSIFRSETAKEFEFHTYLRGMFFNAVMNRLVYPEWKTHISIDTASNYHYSDLVAHLEKSLDCHIEVENYHNLCLSMLWRLKPVFNPFYETVLCRDADAITTFREAQAVQEFLESGMALHGITDNPAHNMPVMGGMIGFRCQPIREKYSSWDNLIDYSKVRIGDRGTDQVFLAQEIYPNFKHKMLGHFLQGMAKGSDCAIVRRQIANFPLPNVNAALWESNLTCRHIGSAGVVEMETIRFLNRFAPDDMKAVEPLASLYPKIFYWV